MKTITIDCSDIEKSFDAGVELEILHCLDFDKGVMIEFSNVGEDFDLFDNIVTDYICNDIEYLVSDIMIDSTHLMVTI